MSGFVVLQQMILIFLLILTGFVLYKKGIISAYASKDLSALVVNICSPGLIIVSMFEDLSSVSRDSVILVGIIGICFFLFLSVLGFLFVKIFKIPVQERVSYILMTVFGNLGFIGIPVALAIIWTESMVYVIVFNFLFNVYIYTFGVMLLKKGSNGVRTSLKDILSPGLLACIVAFCIYWFDIQLPKEVETAAGYYGNACTLLFYAGNRNFHGRYEGEKCAEKYQIPSVYSVALPGIPHTFGFVFKTSASRFYHAGYHCFNGRASRRQSFCHVGKPIRKRLKSDCRGHYCDNPAFCSYDYSYIYVCLKKVKEIMK